MTNSPKYVLAKRLKCTMLILCSGVTGEQIQSDGNVFADLLTRWK